MTPARRTWRWGGVVAAAALVLGSAGCRGNNDNQPAAAEPNPTVSLGGKAPDVTGSSVKLSLASTGIKIVPADGDTTGHSGHYVVFVDQPPPAPGGKIPTGEEADGIYHTSDSSLTVRGEDPGSHIFVVVLADGSNARLGDTRDTATATIAPPGITLGVSHTSPDCKGQLVTVTPDGFSLPVVSPSAAVLDATGQTVVPSTEATTTTTSASPPISIPATTSTTTAASAAAASASTTTAAGPTTTAAPPPPAAITYFVDRLPLTAALTSSDVGAINAASYSLCVINLTAGHHSVWAIVVDGTGAPLTAPIEGRITFDTSA